MDRFCPSLKRSQRKWRDIVRRDFVLDSVMNMYACTLQAATHTAI